LLSCKLSPKDYSLKAKTAVVQQYRQWFLCRGVPTVTPLALGEGHLGKHFSRIQNFLHPAPKEMIRPEIRVFILQGIWHKAISEEDRS